MDSISTVIFIIILMLNFMKTGELQKLIRFLQSKYSRLKCFHFKKSMIESVK